MTCRKFFHDQKTFEEKRLAKSKAKSNEENGVDQLMDNDDEET